MAVLQMQKISICALRKDRDALLKKLQMLGNVQLQDVTPAEGDDFFSKEDTTGQCHAFDRKVHLTEQALDILEPYMTKTGGPLAGLAGKDVVSTTRVEEVLKREDAILQQAEKIGALSKEIVENNSSIGKLRNKIASLAPWMDLDIPMGGQDTLKTHTLLGFLPPETDEETIFALIAHGAQEEQERNAVNPQQGAETVQERETSAVSSVQTASTDGTEISPAGVPLAEEDLAVPPAVVQLVSRDKDDAYFAITVLKDDARRVENWLHAGGFSSTAFETELPPRREAERLEEKIASLEAKNEKLSAEIASFADIQEDLKTIGDHYRIKSSEYEGIARLAQSGHTFITSGYIPAGQAARTGQALEGAFDCVVDLEDIPADTDAPVVLHNNRFSESAEGVLRSYGLPRRGEFDPTTIMSFFYIIFFGLMLSDAAYGLIMAVGCFTVLHKYPRMEDGTRKMLKLFGQCGVSTIVWGILFGGYFGDAPTVIAKTFFHADFRIPALWFEPLTQPMKLLMFCMAFGLVHLFLGLAIKGYEDIKEKQYLDFFCDIVLWYMFLIGLLLVLLPTDMFASISQMSITFPAWLSTFAKVLAVVGAVGLLLMSGRSSKNPVLRIALGAYDLYNITGWLSDVLSYSRLLALGLATGVIASVVNQMGAMAGGGIGGAILFIVVFIVGHSMNMAINVLGAYVHTNRLQFAEFFSKFYEGGGEEFKPFQQGTKYIDVKEVVK